MSPVRRSVLIVLRLAALLIIPCSIPALAAGSFSLTASELTMAEALLLGAVGYAFNLDTDVVLHYRTHLGTAEGTVTLAYVSQATGYPSDILITARKNGMAWEDIVASALPPGLRNKPADHPGRMRHEARIRQGVDPYEYEITVRFLAEYYAVEGTMLESWLAVGISLDDLALSLNLAARVGVDPNDILRLRRNSVEWEWKWLAARYGITLHLLHEPVPPKSRSFAAAASRGR